ncbi:MAG: four helix bundle protein [Chitinophagales bacterium]|nr:four helix bundle protein [Chitinophagales bacterium]
MHNYRELQIWKDGIALAKDIYILTNDFPKDELFGLTSQIRRSVVSIASNIVEGSGRDTAKDFNHFLAIATGSAFELDTQLTLAKEFNYVSEEKLNPILEKLSILQKMIYRFKEKINL